jgi:hypothetical protein
MTESDRSVTQSTKETYHAVRSQIEHEDTQINQRVSWLLISHSFLFTAFAITVTNQSRDAGSASSTFPLLVLIPCLAVFSSLLIGVSIVGGILAMRDLRSRFGARPDARAAEGIVLLHASRGVRTLGLLTPLLLTLLYASVWLFLLIRAVA